MTLQDKRLSLILLAVTGLLTIPLIAMQFSTGWDWDATDFIIAGFLLYGTGLACEFVLRRVRTTGRRIAICAVLLFTLFLIWAELAVGIFGTPFAGS